jgi:peptidoglycan/LPS O-acetylase OafA/YrhL
MTADDVRNHDRRRLARTGLIALAGAAAGAGLAYAGAEVVPDLPLPDLLACVVGAALLLAGGVSILISSNRKALSAAYELEGEASDGELRAARRQGAVMILAGLLLAWPVMAARADWIDAPVAYAAVLLVFGLQTALNWSVWRNGDELIRRTVAEAGAVSFWLMQGALFLYAAAERLALAPAATAWQITVAMMAGYLVLSSAVATRRGCA